MEKQLTILLKHIKHYDRGVDDWRLVDDVIRECKRKRKRLSKEEATEQGFNIYAGKGIKIGDVIKYALDNEYISIIGRKNKDTLILKIAKKGAEHLERIYTDNFSEEYRAYEKAADEIAKEFNRPRLERFHLMCLFSKKETLKHIKAYINKIDTDVLDYQRFAINSFTEEDIKGKYIFNLTPKLFVPVEYIGEKVSLAIEGVGVPTNMIISSPYPNRRYYVAGLKVGKEKTDTGIYPIIAAKEDFPSKLNIKLIWKVGDSFQITHHLFINFKFGEEPGELFSTCQRIAGSTNLPSFDINTYMETDKELWRDRDVEAIIDAEEGIVDIIENINLTNFPMDMLHNFYASRYFRKWREKKVY